MSVLGVKMDECRRERTSDGLGITEPCLGPGGPLKNLQLTKGSD